MIAARSAPILFSRGYVTTYSSIARRSRSDIERSLGFDPARLQKGYTVYALVGIVTSREFIWRDKTRYSAGWHADPSITFDNYPDTIWCVQRRDELRAAMLKKYNGNERLADIEITRIIELAASRLNIRIGPQKIVKVVPKITYGNYPDADFCDVPQWELTVEKQFQLIEESPAL